VSARRRRVSVSCRRALGALGMARRATLVPAHGALLLGASDHTDTNVPDGASSPWQCFINVCDDCGLGDETSTTAIAKFTAIAYVTTERAGLWAGSATAPAAAGPALTLPPSAAGQRPAPGAQRVDRCENATRPSCRVCKRQTTFRQSSKQLLLSPTPESTQYSSSMRMKLRSSVGLCSMYPSSQPGPRALTEWSELGHEQHPGIHPFITPPSACVRPSQPWLTCRQTRPAGRRSAG
jgi:hypothetical protein